MNRFIEVVRALKRRSQSSIACPRCGNIDLSKSTGMDGWMLPPLYLCGKCGYAGRIVLEIDSEDLARGGDRGDRSAEQ